eukprot:c16136_g1_i1 orf=29-232(+)
MDDSHRHDYEYIVRPWHERAHLGSGFHSPLNTKCKNITTSMQHSSDKSLLHGPIYWEKDVTDENWGI